ncbi:hypothetical protein V8F33_011488 [Rhypophila sp. PSN 637]
MPTPFLLSQLPLFLFFDVGFSVLSLLLSWFSVCRSPTDSWPITHSHLPCRTTAVVERQNSHTRHIHHTRRLHHTPRINEHINAHNATSAPLVVYIDPIHTKTIYNLTQLLLSPPDKFVVSIPFVCPGPSSLAHIHTTAHTLAERLKGVSYVSWAFAFLLKELPSGSETRLEAQPSCALGHEVIKKKKENKN